MTFAALASHSVRISLASSAGDSNSASVDGGVMVLAGFSRSDRPALGLAGRFSIPLFGDRSSSLADDKSDRGCGDDFLSPGSNREATGLRVMPEGPGEDSAGVCFLYAFSSVCRASDGETRDVGGGYSFRYNSSGGLSFRGGELDRVLEMTLFSGTP